MDKAIIVGVTRTEADDELLRLIRNEQRRRNNTNEELAFYFDVLPQDATKDEMSIYYNEGPIMLQEK